MFEKIESKHLNCMGEKRNMCIILMGKPEGKRLLGRPTHA
jgi:hypothetical protein